MDAGSGRLERAADRIYLILGIYRDKMPNEAVEALQGVAAALGAATEPAPATNAIADAAIKAKAQGFDRICLRCLCGFSRTDECPRCQPTETAQAVDAVAWAVRDFHGGDCGLPRLDRTHAEEDAKFLDAEGPSTGPHSIVPLYAAPPAPGVRDG